MRLLTKCRTLLGVSKCLSFQRLVAAAAAAAAAVVLLLLLLIIVIVIIVIIIDPFSPRGEWTGIFILNN